MISNSCRTWPIQNPKINNSFYLQPQVGDDSDDNSRRKGKRNVDDEDSEEDDDDDEDDDDQPRKRGRPKMSKTSVKGFNDSEIRRFIKSFKKFGRPMTRFVFLTKRKIL